MGVDAEIVDYSSPLGPHFRAGPIRPPRKAGPACLGVPQSPLKFSVQVRKTRTGFPSRVAGL